MGWGECCVWGETKKAHQAMFLMGLKLAVWIPRTRETRDPPEYSACRYSNQLNSLELFGDQSFNELLALLCFQKFLSFDCFSSGVEFFRIDKFPWLFGSSISAVCFVVLFQPSFNVFALTNVK